MPEKRLTWVRRLGIELVLAVLIFHIEGVQLAQIQGLQPGKIGLVAVHQVAGGNAPAIKHLVSDVPILPGSVDQFLHVPAVLDLPGKENQLVEQSVEMHFLVDVGLIGLFLNDIQRFLFHSVLISEFWA